MAAELSLKASGIRLLKGVAGSIYHHSGQIIITKAAVKGIDSNLLRIFEAAVDDLGIVITLDSIDTGQGQHVPNSRHFHGCAADMDHVYAVGQPPQVASLANYEARALVAWFIEQGFTAGHENGNYPAVLFGPVGTKYNQTAVSHLHHVHASLHPAPGE